MGINKMMKRREVKKRARQSVRKHYGILFAVCLIASFLGTVFTSPLDFVKQYKVDVLESTENSESQEALSTGVATGSTGNKIRSRQSRMMWRNG